MAFKFGNAAPPNVPIIGQPTIMGAVVVVSLQCSCEAHPVLMAAAGTPFQCALCKKGYFADAKIELQIKGIVVGSDAGPKES